MSDDKKDFEPPVPKATQLPVKEKATEKERIDLHKKVGEILAEYDNKESNIPLNHEYWDLMNRFRAL